jgi:hypothetical protein
MLVMTVLVVVAMMMPTVMVTTTMVAMFMNGLAGGRVVGASLRCVFARPPSIGGFGNAQGQRDQDDRHTAGQQLMLHKSSKRLKESNLRSTTPMLPGYFPAATPRSVNA